MVYNNKHGLGLFMSQALNVLTLIELQFIPGTSTHYKYHLQRVNS